MQATSNRWIVAFLFAGLFVGCAQFSSGPGALDVDVVGLSAGLAADATVTGPGGYTQAVSADVLLDDLDPGSYTVEARAVVGNEAVVPPIYVPTSPSQQVNVRADTTASVVVDHVESPGSGRLWVATDGATPLDGYDAEQLATSGAPAPAAQIGGTTFLGEGIAFDADGNAWVASWEAGLRRYARADLVDGGSVTPDVALLPDGAATPSLFGASGIAFAGDGFLWVASYGGDRLEGFAPAQLAASGTPSPAITVDGVIDPHGIAFDASGNLWVASRTTSTIVAFTPAQLVAGGSPTAWITLTDDGSGSLAEPQGIAFDASGSLWVANSDNTTVVRFSPEQLSASGSPTPVATIGSASFSDGGVAGLAIDHDGALWVATWRNSVVHRIEDAADLSGSVTPAVSVELTIDAFDTAYPTFWPPPPGVPIRTP